MSTIEQRVMANVGVVYAARQLVSATALKVYVLIVGLYTLVQLTWVHRVFQNWQEVGLARSWQFLSYAIVHTHMAVQVTLAVVVAAALWLCVDAIRTLSRPQSLYSLR